MKHLIILEKTIMNQCDNDWKSRFKIIYLEEFWLILYNFRSCCSLFEFNMHPYIFISSVCWNLELIQDVEDAIDFHLWVYLQFIFWLSFCLRNFSRKIAACFGEKKKEKKKKNQRLNGINASRNYLKLLKDKCWISQASYFLMGQF